MQASARGQGRRPDAAGPREALRLEPALALCSPINGVIWGVRGVIV